MNIRLFILSLILPAAVFAQQRPVDSRSTFHDDSVRIVRYIAARYPSVRSGKINYQTVSDGSFISKPREDNFEFEFSYLSQDKDLTAKWGRSLVRQEVLFFHDTAFIIDPEEKVLFYEKISTKEFLDDYELEIGIFPKITEDIFRDRGYYALADTVIDGDTCIAITMKRYDVLTEDTVSKVFVLSKNIHTHSSCLTTASGECGNYRSVLERCTRSEFSGSPDTKLLPKLKAYVNTLLRDSGFTIYPSEYSSDFYDKKNKRLRDGDVFPVTAFETEEGRPVDISKDSPAITILDFNRPGKDPCGRNVASISALYGKYKEKDVHIYSVYAFDRKSEEKEVFRTYAKRYSMSFPVLFSDKQHLFNQLGISSDPTYIILDKDLKVRNIYHTFSRGIVPPDIETKIQAYIGQ